MTISTIVKELENLDTGQLDEVSAYIHFLKIKKNYITSFKNEDIAKAYAQFSEEDNEFAEFGIEDYTAQLKKEDTM